jgi:hypothetical protein
MSNECQWENCSGGEHCPKHSLTHNPHEETTYERAERELLDKQQEA